MHFYEQMGYSLVGKIEPFGFEFNRWFNTINIDKIINQAHKSGANFIYPMFGVTLRANQRFYYYTKLRENFPNLVSKYQNLYGDKYVCNSPNFKSLQKYFEE